MIMALLCREGIFQRFLRSKGYECTILNHAYNYANFRHTARGDLEVVRLNLDNQKVGLPIFRPKIRKNPQISIGEKCDYLGELDVVTIHSVLTKCA